MWHQSPHPQSFGIFTFSSSVQDGAKIEKDMSSSKAELNEISFFDYRDKQTHGSGSLSCFGTAASSPPSFAALGDVHSNSYGLPPAVQSVLLQWTLPVQVVIICGSA